MGTRYSLFLMGCLASTGYTCQGNEFSYFMLLAGNFALNQYMPVAGACSNIAHVTRACLCTARAVDSLTELNQYTFYPAVTTSSNVVNTLDQLKYESAFRGVRATICELELTYPSVHITERTRYRTCCRATSRAPPDSPCVPATLSRSIGISQPSGTAS